MEDNNDFIIKAHIMNPNSITEVAELTSKGTKLEDLVVVSTERDCLSIYKTLFDMVAPKYVLIPDNSIFRRSIRSNRILFEDYFPKEQRNSDYKGKDEFFRKLICFLRMKITKVFRLLNCR